MSIITITGPTCSGKTTIESKLQQLGFGRAISHTTRWPRSGEVDGVQYHFVDEEKFKTLESSGKFVETIKFGTSQYAMSAESIILAQEISEHIVIVVDPIGASQIKDFCEENGLKNWAIWVDCLPEIQARRWMSRMVSDMITGSDVLGAYTERLGIMLGRELEWRSAATSLHPYDLMLSSNVCNSEELAGYVADLVSTKQVI